MLGEASKLPEGTAHLQVEHREGHMDVPIPYPCYPWAPAGTENRFSHLDKLSLAKGHSWDSTK